MNMEFYIEINGINEYRLFYRTGWRWKKLGHMVTDSTYTQCFHQYIFHTAQAAIDALNQYRDSLDREKKKNTWKRYYSEVKHSV